MNQLLNDTYITQLAFDIIKFDLLDSFLEGTTSSVLICYDKYVQQSGNKVDNINLPYLSVRKLLTK